MNTVETVAETVISNNGEIYLLIVKYVCASALIALGACITAIAQSRVASKTIEAIASNYNAEKVIRGVLWGTLLILEMSTIWCLIVVGILLFK